MSAARHAPLTASELLTSWKDIAAYLKRGVRTVQRWETELGLPVHRFTGRNRTAVLAFRSELDRWAKKCPVMQPGISARHSFPALKLESERLRNEVWSLHLKVSATLSSLLDNVRKTPGQSLTSIE